MSGRPARGADRVDPGPRGHRLRPRPAARPAQPARMAVSPWSSASARRQPGLDDLNLHFHVLVLDGVYTWDLGPARQVAGGNLSMGAVGLAPGESIRRRLLGLPPLRPAHAAADRGLGPGNPGRAGLAGVLGAGATDTGRGAGRGLKRGSATGGDGCVFGAGRGRQDRLERHGACFGGRRGALVGDSTEGAVPWPGEPDLLHAAFPLSTLARSAACRSSRPIRGCLLAGGGELLPLPARVSGVGPPSTHRADHGRVSP